MSDTSEDAKPDRQIDKEDSVCRDFTRGTCDRKFCKYKHEHEPKTLNFCHDFQNTLCPRQNCKFIHCTADEEIEFKNTGIMSNHILAEATRKNQLPGLLPICNQFRKGLCRRSYCKYRHLTKEEEETEIMELIRNNSNNGKSIIGLNNSLPEAQFAQLNSPNGLHRRNNPNFDDYEDCGMPLPKRRFISSKPDQEIVSNNDFYVDSIRNRPVFKGYFAGNPPPPMLSRIDARTFMLEEENNLLHKEIAQLKRQVSDLTATNEFLLDQNANLRVSNKRNETVNMPAVSITNTNSPQMIRTVTASVATVPVSLATVSTCNPVSVSIAGCPTVSMTQPAQLLAPSQQILVTTNPSTQLAIANSSQAQLAIAQQSLATNLAQPQAQLTSTQAQQLALAATTTQQLTLANTQQTHQQLNQAQAQQLALGNPTQQQQLTMGNTAQHLTVTSVPQQLTIAGTNQQLLDLPNLTSNQQIEMHRNGQINAINTSQAIAMSNATQPMVSFPIMTQSINHALAH